MLDDGFIAIAVRAMRREAALEIVFRTNLILGEQLHKIIGFKLVIALRATGKSVADEDDGMPTLWTIYR